jgi:hypothetical protein
VSEIRSFWREAMTFEAGVAEIPLRSVVLLVVLPVVAKVGFKKAGRERFQTTA